MPNPKPSRDWHEPETQVSSSHDTDVPQLTWGLKLHCWERSLGYTCLCQAPATRKLWTKWLSRVTKQPLLHLRGFPTGWSFHYVHGREDECRVVKRWLALHTFPTPLTNWDPQSPWMKTNNKLGSDVVRRVAVRLRKEWKLENLVKLFVCSHTHDLYRKKNLCFK